LQEDSENRENTINSELSNLLHFPIRLNPTQIQNLVTDPMSMENSLKNVIRSGMSQIMIHRLVLTFEKRLKESWNIKISEFSSQSWDDVEQSIVQLVKDSLSRKSARLLGDEGEIARDLQANKVILDSALKDDGDLMRLLILITQGKVLTFDSKSHRKQFKAETRLSYVFLLAELIKDIPTDILTKNILNHLETAVEKFVKVFGNAELENLQNKEINLVSLPKSQSEKIATELGEEVFEAIKEKSLIEIDADIKEQLVDNLGKQTQNRIYRNLLLGTITEAWVEYLTRMEALRVSISMESYAQRDPLVQYKSEASRMFTELLSEVRAGVISRMFRYRPTQAADPQSQVKTATPISSEPEGTKQLQSETKPKKKKRKRHL
jgi:preprotein translocase subunit SecA